MPRVAGCTALVLLRGPKLVLLSHLCHCLHASLFFYRPVQNKAGIQGRVLWRAELLQHFSIRRFLHDMGYCTCHSRLVFRHTGGHFMGFWASRCITHISALKSQAIGVCLLLPTQAFIISSPPPTPPKKKRFSLSYLLSIHKERNSALPSKYKEPNTRPWMLQEQ